MIINKHPNPTSPTHVQLCQRILVFLSFFLQDLKDPRRRDDLAAARAVLKKNSMMLLTTSKVGLVQSGQRDVAPW